MLPPLRSGYERGMYARVWLAVAAAAMSVMAVADTLELTDGTVIRNCYTRDEGIRIQVWRNLDAVGTPPENIPRSRVKSVKIERGDAWDIQPNLSDLSVTFIEVNPKLAGLHGKVDYDVYGRPTIVGGGALVTLGEDRKYDHPEEAVANIKLKYKPGETITMTANVKNVGFANATAFDYEWLMDGQPLSKGSYRKGLKAGQLAQFTQKWAWQEGFHSVTFKVKTNQKQIAVINDEITDPLWAWAYDFYVNKGRVAAWRQNRTAYGTFSFEDYYQWHVQMMNLLFAESKFPATPNGSRARVRLDRIVVLDDVPDVSAVSNLYAPDGIRYNQGQWSWADDQDKNKNWTPPTKEWRNQTEWSLPHELGHQLGFIDWYCSDYPGDEKFTMADNGDKIGHFQTYPNQMMHWHGPHLWGEVDAANADRTYDMPRGYYGDYVFAMPDECFVRILDVNGQGVPNATVEIFQRGTTIDKSKSGGEDHGVKWFPVVEDGDFHERLSETPVMVGQTDDTGLMRLANRPAMPVKSLAGFVRKNNPFGNMNVVGSRQLMLMRVTKNGRPAHFWLEAYQFNAQWYRGNTKSVTFNFRAPFGSSDSPIAPASVKAERLDNTSVRVAWEPSPVPHERQYLEWVVGYRVYRRVTSDGLEGRPWMPIATLGPDARSFVVNLKQLPEENWWNAKTERFAVTAIGFSGRESELTETVLK